MKRAAEAALPEVSISYYLLGVLGEPPDLPDPEIAWRISVSACTFCIL